MRLIIDYLYATQIIGLLTSITLVIAITYLITKVYPFENFDKISPGKKIYYHLLIGVSVILCIFVLLQATINPLNAGRAGVIRQVVILNKTIVFIDLYPLGGSELGDTPPLLRAWVLNRETGKLVTRKSIETNDPILGANENSLLIGENDTCYLTDDRLKKTVLFFEDNTYRNKKVHRFAFNNGALFLSFTDFSEARIPMPLFARYGTINRDIDIKYMDTDRETYIVTRRLNNRVIWQLDQSSGSMREAIPDLLYESPSNDLYLLWTEYRLKAISKKTGETAWTFWY